MELDIVKYNTVINTNTNLNINTSYYVDTISGVLTLTLPNLDNLNNKHIFIKIIDSKNNFHINPVILVCLGTNKILENCSSYRLYESTELIFNNNWYFKQELQNYCLPNPLNFINCDYGNIKNFCLNLIKKYNNNNFVVNQYPGWRPANFTNGALIEMTYSPYNNCIYIIPFTYPIVVGGLIPYIDCFTNTVKTFTSNLTIEVNAYTTGIYDPYNLRIWLVPYGISNKSVWHYINIANNTFVEYTHGFGTTLPIFAYRRGVYSPKQLRIYFAPLDAGPLTNWHYINLVTKTIVAYTHGLTPVFPTSAFFTLIYTHNNRIYFIPSNENIVKRTSWFYLNCDNNTFVSYQTNITYPTNIIITDAVYCPINNSIYVEPIVNTGTNWYYINIETNIISQYTFPITTNYSFKDCMTYIPTWNCIFIAPIENQNLWYFINCRNNTVFTFNSGITNRGGFENAIYCPYNNNIYLSPDRNYNITNFLYLNFGNQNISAIDQQLFSSAIFKKN